MGEYNSVVSDGHCLRFDKKEQNTRRNDRHTLVSKLVARYIYHCTQIVFISQYCEDNVEIAMDRTVTSNPEVRLISDGKEITVAYALFVPDQDKDMSLKMVYQGGSRKYFNFYLDDQLAVHIMGNNWLFP